MAHLACITKSLAPFSLQPYLPGQTSMWIQPTSLPIPLLYPRGWIRLKKNTTTLAAWLWIYEPKLAGASALPIHPASWIPSPTLPEGYSCLLSNKTSSHSQLIICLMTEMIRKDLSLLPVFNFTNPPASLPIILSSLPWRWMNCL